MTLTVRFENFRLVLKRQCHGRLRVVGVLADMKSGSSGKVLWALAERDARGFWKVKDHIYILMTVAGRDFPRFHIPILIWSLSFQNLLLSESIRYLGGLTVLTFHLVEVSTDPFRAEVMATNLSAIFPFYLVCRK